MVSYRTIAKCALGAGLILLSAGCSGRKEVAIAAKDDTIRSQNDEIARQQTELAHEKDLIDKEKREKEEAARLNEQLARQNQELADRDAKLAAENAARTAELSKQVNDLEGIMKSLQVAQAKPNEVGVPADKDAVGFRDSQGGIHIIVASTAFFDAGKADLKSTSHPMLQRVAHTIRERFPRNYIRIEGHTDSTPVVHSKNKYPDNMALSIARAQAVYDYLARDGGIPAHKMYTAGYGQFQPLVHPERTAEDRRKNRRVEIVIMPENVKVQKDSLASGAPVSASRTVRK